MVHHPRLLNPDYRTPFTDNPESVAILAPNVACSACRRILTESEPLFNRRDNLERRSCEIDADSDHSDSGSDRLERD